MHKARILVDLKPALDGFAGIPQESRLLFSNLLHMPDFADVDGLLQHGTGNYFPIHVEATDGRASADNILPVSDFLSVLTTGVEKFYIPRAPVFIQRRIHNQILRLMSYTGKKLKMGKFQTDQFDDLIWRALFSKAVDRQDMELVCRARFRTLEMPRQHMQNIALEGVRIFPAKKYFRVDTSDYDIVISQMPLPARLSKNTKLVVRYHDSTPIFMPHTIADLAIHKAMHFRALKSNVADGAWFSCVSEASRADLLKLFPEVEDRSFVIHNTVIGEYEPCKGPKQNAWDVIGTFLSSEHENDLPTALQAIEQAKSAGDDFILMVSTLEPRKNHETLIAAFNEYRQRAGNNVRLVLVGAKGWHCDEILAKVKSGIARGSILHLTNVPTHSLKSLYSHAAVTVCPSVFEGFDYSGVEALRCGGSVLASDIPVHKEVYKDGARYFDPYDQSDLAEALEVSMSSEVQSSEQRRKRATEISENYSANTLRDVWRDRLDTILETSK